MLVVPTDVRVQSLRELLNARGLPVAGIEQFVFEPPEEAFTGRIALQDCGSFVRMFVPPAGGIVGAGDSLSGMRDVMVYLPDGQAVSSGLLDRKLVQLYLHTLTNGVLVGWDNSKMSMLEKLARLALEN